MGDVVGGYIAYTGFSVTVCEAPITPIIIVLGEDLKVSILERSWKTRVEWVRGWVSRFHFGRFMASLGSNHC